MSTTIAFAPDRLAAAKRAFTTRRAPAEAMRSLVAGETPPRAGDLVLARVLSIGSHQKLEAPEGRRALLRPGDEIIVSYGARYAPDQFEAVVPEALGPCDLVAGGGVAAKMLCRHERMRAPTRLQALGLLGDGDGTPLNLARFALPPAPPATVTVTLVVGTAMNAGKTFAAAALIAGLKAGGARVAGIKATGTGSGGDLWQMRDHGADVALDFTDAGLPSTYMQPFEVVEACVHRLIDEAGRLGCAHAVVEIADGLGHGETAALMRSAPLRARSAGVLFAAYDAMGAVGGAARLEALGHRLLAVSGQLTRSPLAMREASAEVSVPILTASAIADGALNAALGRAAACAAAA